MTVYSPPLIKPDRRFSRIRLSEFLAPAPMGLGASVSCKSRTFLALIAQRAVASPSLRFTAAEQVASLRSPVCSPNQRSGTGSSLLRTPPTPVVARTAFPFEGVAPPVESSLLAITGLPAYPSVTSRHVAHADPAGLLSRPSTVGLDRNPSAFAMKLKARLHGTILSRLIYVVHMFITTCRFDSMPAPHPASRRRSWHGLQC